MITKNPYKLVIIGSGPAGLTAAIYAARAQLQPLIVEGQTPGGQLMGTTLVENWPGTASIMGPALMMDMKAHAERMGASFSSTTIEKVSFEQRPFTLITNKQEHIAAEAVIVASGATPRRLNCPGEAAYWGKGVSTCAVCDGALYRGKKIIVVGGGDTAMEDASFMARLGNEVTVVHIRNQLSASVSMQKRVIDRPHITVRYQATVTEVRGTGDRVTGVVITDQVSQEQTELSADGVFIAIGQQPNSGFLGNSVARNERGIILTFDGTQTSVAGVFAAGDVVDTRYRQAITSAGDGCRAALDAERFLAEHAARNH